MSEEETTTQPPLETQPPERPPMYQPPPPPSGYPPQEPGAVDLGALMRGRKGEPLTLEKAYLLRAMMREDRAEKRLDMEWQDRQHDRDKKEPVNIGKVVGDAVQTAVSGVMDEIKPLLPNANAKPSEEKPEWAKSLEDQNKTILKRFETEDQEKHDRKLIEEATGSLKQQIGDLQSQLNTVTTKETSEPKSMLDGYLKTRKQLKEAGLLQENPPGTIKLGDEGIPVSGSVPAWVVYGPKVADDVLAAAEKRIDGIISKIMLLGTTEKGKEKGKDIIEIPPKPAPPRGYPPLKPAKPPEETKKEETKKEPELVEIPPRPKPPIETPPQPPKETKPETTTEKIESIEYKRGLPSKPEVVKVTSKEEVSKTTQLEETKIGSETMQPTDTTKEAVTEPTETKEVEIEQTTDEVEVVTIPDSQYPTVKPDKSIDERIEAEASIPPYTRQGLEDMKMTELWQIANKLGTSRSGKKEELIDRILEASEKVKTNVEGEDENSTD